MLAQRRSRIPTYGEIFKQYIRSKGECMQIYRFFYYSSLKAPVAVGFIKRIKFSDSRHGPDEKFLISDMQLELVDSFIQSGKAITRMQDEAKKLCNFLSAAYGFRIEELVVDFVRDKFDTYWLMNVKSFTLEPSNYKIKKLEYEKSISQSVVLETLREQAKDSSTFLCAH
eukprot:TRINITY_DN14240_c0_g1_i1.p1 TRINITY_DN14240_c0_g1~~TRINITY_DN14240_c0_g1_i1.p1  ORF type:complete len:170 (+),score=36.79 TRINITY_DN14240_c0_g1_i1:628-1137(+)